MWNLLVTILLISRNSTNQRNHNKMEKTFLVFSSVAWAYFLNGPNAAALKAPTLIRHWYWVFRMFSIPYKMVLTIEAFHYFYWLFYVCVCVSFFVVAWWLTIAFQQTAVTLRKLIVTFRILNVIFVVEFMRVSTFFSRNVLLSVAFLCRSLPYVGLQSGAKN